MRSAGLSDLRNLFVREAGDKLLPPRRKNFNVPGASAAEYRRNVMQNRRGNLQMLQTALAFQRQSPESAERAVSVLDFGCAFSPIGQVYALDPQVEPRIQAYLGVDIDANAIAWCKHISEARGEFQFRHYDAEHERYYDLPAGSQPDAIRPAHFGGLWSALGESRFDIQMSSSVFTHLYLREFEEFAQMMAKHMNPGGILFNSVFLMDPSLDLPHSGPSAFSRPDRKFFKCDDDALTADCYIYAAENPRAGIAFARRAVVDTAARMKDVELVGFLYGTWRGIQRAPVSPNYQDWIIMRKR